MPKRWRAAFALCALATVLSPGGPVAAGREGEARQYLDRAVYEYRRGVEERARLYLNMAREIDPAGMDRSADARRLNVLLLLAGEKDREAMAALVEALPILPDPFLLYALGRFNLDNGAYDAARRAYREAARRAAAATPAADDSPPTYEPAFAPFACPVRAGEADAGDAWLAEATAAPFRDPFAYERLWQKRLSREETALAAAAALFLTPRRAEGPDAEERELREILARTRPRAEDGNAPNDLFALLEAPDDDDRHRACIRNLEDMERRLNQRIQRGATETAGLALRTLRVATERGYYLRMRRFGDVRGAFAYGAYQLRVERPIKALHAFRIAYLRNLAGAETAPGVDWNNRERTRAQAQILRQLEATYRNLGAAADERSAGLLARGLERFLESGAQPSAVPETDLYLFQRSGENLMNRESLLFLIARARARNEERALFYERKLRERDRAADERELLSAWDYARF